MNLEKFGKFIKELRKEKGLNQEQLAEELLVHRTTIVKWEQGKSLPINDTLVMLSKYFNVSVDELLAGERLNTIEDKNKVTLSLLTSRRKSIRIAKYFAIISFIFFITFLIYYFFTTYNSIHVYLLYGQGETIDTRDGMLIISNDKAYLRIGNIYTKDGKFVEVKNISMYAENNTDTKLLFNGDPKQLLVESTDNVELFKFNNLKDRFENLYLIVNISNKEESIKLTAIKDFENKSLFKILFSKTNETYVDNNIKLKLSDKFVYDKDTDTYKLKDNNVEIECTEDIICRIIINDLNNINYYIYDRFGKELTYQNINNNYLNYKLIIDLNKRLSQSEENLYNEFKEKILDKYLS